MNSETKICQNCKQQFTIEPDDFSFYEKIKVPAPTWCPECRLVRRMLWRNERSLYKRKCDLCNQDKILMYRPDSQGVVYCRECFLSDSWNPLKFGRDYDFSKSFFDQFADLLRVAPRPGIIQQGNNVNSEYTNRSSDNRNNYLIFNTISGEYCSYGNGFNYSKECMDCYYTQKSERCYECANCFNCFNLLYSKECIACNDSFFLSNCRNCQSCFGCVNLRNKSYCIFNKQFSKEDYQKTIGQFNLGSSIVLDSLMLKFKSETGRHPLPALIEHHSDKVTGNWIEESKNIEYGFQCLKVKDGKYLLHIVEAEGVMDYSFWGVASENVYETINSGRQLSNVAFSNECWDQVINVRYSMNCHNSQNLFGCIGLRNKQYCVLNKEYSKSEYEAMLPKIIESLRQNPYEDGRGRKYYFGDFFPGELSPFAYNETIAQEYFPLTKEETLKTGYRWKDPETKNYTITKKPGELPDNIKDVDDSVLGAVIGCAHEGKCSEQCTAAFKIITQELQFYRKMNLPLPRLCPNCRHYQRLKQRNPLKLWHRKCTCVGSKSENGLYQNTASHFHGTDHCPNEFETSYAPERPEIVYCEQCYQAEVV